MYEISVCLVIECLTIRSLCYCSMEFLVDQCCNLVFAHCSVSSLMTTTESVIVELPKNEDAPAMGAGMGGMGGMDY